MMNSSLSTTEHAAYIRHQLKTQYGWTSRQVSVKARSYSMGSSIDVRIKDASVPIAVVKEIAQKAERIDRDPSGEILSGGNRFVSVSYDSDVLQAMGERWSPAVEAAAGQLADGDDHSLIAITGTAMYVGRSSRGMWALWGKGGHIQDGWELASIARAVAVRMVGAP